MWHCLARGCFRFCRLSSDGSPKRGFASCHALPDDAVFMAVVFRPTLPVPKVTQVLQVPQVPQVPQVAIVPAIRPTRAIQGVPGNQGIRGNPGTVNIAYNAIQRDPSSPT